MMTKRVVYVFIDASNLWQVQKAKGKFFDFQKLTAYLKNRYRATEIKVFYYTAYPADGTRSYDLEGKHRFYTYLKKALEFEVRKKVLKQIKVDTHGGTVIEEKGNMDIEIAIDAVNLVNKYNSAILFTGDSDFLGLVKYIRARHKKVHIFSSRNNISSELRTGADGYTDILRIEEDIWGNTLRYREQKKSK